MKERKKGMNDVNLYFPAIHRYSFAFISGTVQRISLQHVQKKKIILPFPHQPLPPFCSSHIYATWNAWAQSTSCRFIRFCSLQTTFMSVHKDVNCKLTEKHILFVRKKSCHDLSLRQEKTREEVNKKSIMHCSDRKICFVFNWNMILRVLVPKGTFLYMWRFFSRALTWWYASPFAYVEESLSF